MTETFQPYFDQLALLHDHLCPRQVLGLRIGMLAAELLQLDLPQTNKRLLTLVETDGCFADGIAIATGCTLGHRTLRLVDFGKAAATFVDTQTSAAFRIVPQPGCREQAREYAPDAKNHWVAQLQGYQLMPNDRLLLAQPVALSISIKDLVSKPGIRVTCEICGEEIVNAREVIRDASILCRACAGQSYYHMADQTLPAISGIHDFMTDALLVAAE